MFERDTAIDKVRYNAESITERLPSRSAEKLLLSDRKTDNFIN